MSKIENGALHPEKELYHVPSLIYDVLDRLQPLLAGHTLQLQLPADLPPIKLDYLQIDQVLTNLIENAVRYTPATSSIEVSARQVGDEMMLCIAARSSFRRKNHEHFLSNLPIAHNAYLLLQRYTQRGKDRNTEPEPSFN